MTARRPNGPDERAALPAFATVMPRVLVVIFAIEALIMCVLARIPPLPDWLETVIDATGLSLISAPVIWLWIVRPLRHRIERQLDAERAMGDAVALSEERQRTIVEAAPDGIVMIDERGTIELANPSVVRMFGWEAHELVGRNVSMLMPPAEREAHDDHLRRYLETGERRIIDASPPRRVVAMRRDGETFPLGLQVNDMSIGDRRKFIGMLRDLTSTVEAEAELQRQFAQLRALHRLFDAMAHDASVDEICHEAVAGTMEALQSDRAAVLLFGSEGRIRFRAWAGLSAEYREAIVEATPWNGPLSETEATQMSDTSTADLPAHIRALLQAEGIRAISVYRIRHEDRLLGFLTTHWNTPHTAREEEARVGMTIARAVALVIDRSRRDAERRRLALAVDSTKDAVVLTDKNGVILRINPGFTRITGWTAEEAIGQTPRLLRSSHTSPAIHQELWSTILDGRTWSGRLVDVRKDGTEYHTWLTISPVFDDEGQIAAFVGVQRDVTTDMAREEELRRGAVRLMQANQELREAKDAAEAATRAKAEFLATMSHEIRTPMNGVLGFTHLLLDTSLDDLQREYVGTIRNSGQALLGIINDILDFSKIEAGRLEIEPLPFDLRRTVGEIVELLQPQAAARGISLDAAFRDGVPTGVLGDEGRVRQVLINLAGNAVKFTERGGVSIEVAHEDGGAPGPGQVRVAVKDTGPGIPEDKLGALFQSFSQVDPSTTRRFGGTGLGLAISRRLVGLMGGRIGVESVAGRGSTFWFTLPVSAEPVAPAAPRSAPSSGAPLWLVRPDDAPVRVLVADDNSVNVKLARHLLEKVGCRVDVAGNGLEAVDLVRRIRYDLVLMDCHMPDMDGLEATRAIRAAETDGRLPIIALTASAMAEDREQALASGMDDFLSKPLLPDALHRCLNRWAA
jgi:PAS domain S-box-containing protein